MAWLSRPAGRSAAQRQHLRRSQLGYVVTRPPAFAIGRQGQDQVLGRPTLMSPLDMSVPGAHQRGGTERMADHQPDHPYGHEGGADPEGGREGANIEAVCAQLLDDEADHAVADEVQPEDVALAPSRLARDPQG